MVTVRHRAGVNIIKRNLFSLLTKEFHLFGDFQLMYFTFVEISEFFCLRFRYGGGGGG